MYCVPTIIKECRWVRMYLSAFLFLHVAERGVVTGNKVTFKLRIELNLFLKICMYKILYVYLRQK